MSNNHFMVDIETMATHHYAPIISIGCVAFNPEDPRRDFENFDEFYVAIDLGSNIKIGRHMDPDTVMWWSDPKQAEALARWKGQLKFELELAIEGFSQYIKLDRGRDGAPRMWGYGPTFDNTILGTAFKQLKIEQPWHYSNDRCLRTLKSLAPYVEAQPLGTTHNALDDARYQTRLLYAIIDRLGINL